MVAYFSMQIGLASAVPTYAAALGVLAGDVLRAAADLGLPFIGVTLLHQKGYFRPRLDAAGRQHEETAGWNVEEFLEPVDARVAVTINSRRVLVGARRRVIEGLDGGTVPVGFARRATAYKRADLLVHDPEQLRALAARAGRLQVVFAGKAHPRDEDGKRMIERVFRAREALRENVTIAYPQNYDMTEAAILTAGADVWLEGHVEGVTGWAIGKADGDGAPLAADSAADAAALYDTLEHTVLPLFYQRRNQFIQMMRYAVATNGSFFTAQRMLQEYVLKACGSVDTAPLAGIGTGRPQVHTAGEETTR